MRLQIIYTLLCVSSVIAATEIDDIAQSIVSQSQAEIDLTTLWQKIETLQSNYPIQDKNLLPMDGVSMDKEIDEMETEGTKKVIRSKMSLIPLKRETLEAMIPDLAIDVANSYTKFGLFYIDIKQV
ncbi:hypothetical protein MOUN0_A04148 [Monosporozyma unispora]|nr:hypothetical protein C6P44_004960 [Kazachstania unispora]